MKTATEVERKRRGAPRKPRTLAESLAAHLVIAAKTRSAVRLGASSGATPRRIEGA